MANPRQHVFGRLMGRLHRCRTTEATLRSQEAKVEADAALALDAADVADVADAAVAAAVDVAVRQDADAGESFLAERHVSAESPVSASVRSEDLLLPRRPSRTSRRHKRQAPIGQCPVLLSLLRPNGFHLMQAPEPLLA